MSVTSTEMPNTTKITLLSENNIKNRRQCKQRGESTGESEPHWEKTGGGGHRGVLQWQNTRLVGSRSWALSLVPQGERERSMILSGATQQEDQASSGHMERVKRPTWST